MVQLVHHGHVQPGQLVQSSAWCGWTNFVRCMVHILLHIIQCAVCTLNNVRQILVHWPLLTVMQTACPLDIRSGHISAPLKFVPFQYIMKVKISSFVPQKLVYNPVPSYVALEIINHESFVSKQYWICYFLYIFQSVSDASWNPIVYIQELFMFASSRPIFERNIITTCF